MTNKAKLVVTLGALTAAQQAVAGAPVELPVAPVWLLLGIGVVALALFRRR